MPRFDNQTVLVTGGTGGQGSSHVRAFHAEGANVVIGAIDAERGAALADELGPRAHFIPLDVTDESSWSAAVQTIEGTFGALDVLVNNAGVQNPPALIEDTEQATWSRILDVNLTGTFLGIKAAAPALRRATGGVHREHRLDDRAGWHRALRAVRREQVGSTRPHPNSST